MFEFLAEKKVNMRWIWNRNWLPQHLLDFLDNKHKELSFDTDQHLVLAINYGWRDELVRWVNKFISENPWKQIDEQSLTNNLDLWDLPNVELVIRTKWNLAKRLSWFLLWWIWYAQLYFTDIKCPAFNSDELQKALEWFDNMADKRNFGK